MTRVTYPGHAQTVGLALVVGMLTYGFGIPGLLAGTLTTAITLYATSLYGFSIGQLAIIALTTQSPGSLVILGGVQVGLFTILWSPVIAPRPVRWLPVTVLSTSGLVAVAVISFRETEAIWLTGSLLMISILATSYLLQRYTRVFILEETPQ